MPIPRTRADFIAEVESAFGKLDAELTAEIGDIPCVEIEGGNSWTVKDLLVVRSWWTRAVTGWIAAGREDAEVELALPAPGFKWSETPALNQTLVDQARDTDFVKAHRELTHAYTAMRECVELLSDRELEQVGVFRWAANYPLVRWLSINTTRQYTTARTYVRKAKVRSAES